MLRQDIISSRLHNQHITSRPTSTPAELVKHMLAMQSQEWYMSLWAIGVRLPKITISEIEEAFNSHTILRTHVLRPTWHFVAPDDIRWLLRLSGPRVHTMNSSYYRKFEIDAPLLKKTRKIIEQVLRDKNFSVRETINEAFAAAKISADRLRLAYIIMHAELEGVICSGPRIGKQFTYALMDEIVPASKSISQEDALQEMAQRYFSTRGPATLHDFAWWSGLSITESKKAIATLDKNFHTETYEGKSYYFPQAKTPKPEATFLIPDYDEYGLSYKDRSMYHHPKWKSQKLGHADYFHAVCVDGYYGGNWQRKLKGDKVEIDVAPFTSLNKSQLKKLQEAGKQYLSFFQSQ